MSTERSDSAWRAWKESSEKFDYFMAGLCSALTAYLGQGFKAVALGANPGTVELAAIVALCASVVAAFKRIEWTVTLFGAMQARVYHEEARGNLASAAQGAAQLLINQATGQLMTPAEALLTAEFHGTRATAVGKKLDEYAAKAEAAYQWRNRLLYLGFGLLVAARVWAAYYGPPVILPPTPR